MKNLAWTVFIAIVWFMAGIGVEKNYLDRRECFAETPMDCPAVPLQDPPEGAIRFDEEENRSYIWRGWVPVTELPLDEPLDKLLMDGEGKLFRVQEVGTIEDGLYEKSKARGFEEIWDSVK